MMVGVQPLAGRPQTVVSDMGAWRFTMSNIPLHDRGDKVRLFRALFFGTLVRGGAVYLPFFDWRRGPRVRNGLPAFPGAVPFSDASLFSDGAGFDGDLPTVSIAAPAAARAGTIVVQGASDQIPTAGEYLGLGERAHVVDAIFPGTPSAGRTTLSIWPPLRNAVAAGDPVETVDPVCRMQIEPKSAEMVLALNLAIVGSVTLDFYESNWT